MYGLKHTLLLVEDSIDDEELSRRAILTSEVPCSVQVVRSGTEALAMLMAPDGLIPDLVVLDFHLPGFNGIEILRALRKNERTRNVPIVMLSALESDKQISECLTEGANSFVKKPTDPKTYIDHVALVIRYWLTVDNRPEHFGRTG